MNSDNGQETKQDNKPAQGNQNKYVDFITQQNARNGSKNEKIERNQKRSQHNSRSIKRNVDKKSFSNNNKIGSELDKKAEEIAKIDNTKGNNKANNRYQNGENTSKYQSIKNKDFKRIERIYTQNPPQNSLTVNKILNGTQYDSLLQPEQKDSNINSKKNSQLTGIFYHSDYNKVNKKANYRFEEKRKSHNNTIISNNYNKDHPPIASKEQLYQQNMHLKSQINELKSLMGKQKIQIQIEKRKNKKFTTQLNREFKKEIYYRGQGHPGLSSLFQLNEYLDEDRIEEQKISRMYSNLNDASEDENIESSPSRQKMDQNMLPSIVNSRINRIFNCIPGSSDQNIVHSSQYMIAGIKQKYQQLEVKYSNVAEQLKALKNTPAMNKLQQVSIYCTVLEESNKKLSSALQTCKEKLAASEGKQQIHFQVYKAAIVQELNEKIEGLKQKNKRVKERNRKLEKQSKENLKVIDYLEKIIISKDNFQQKSSIGVKKINQMMIELEKEFSRQKTEHLQLKQTYKIEQQKMRKKYEGERERLQKLLDNTLNEKNGMIKKLEKEINYLMTIIENWKLSENRDKKQAKNLEKKRKSSNVTGRDQSGTERSNQPSLGQNSKVQQKKQTETETQKKMIESRIREIRESQLQNSERGKQASSFQRKRKTSGLKHNEQSKKQRKVNLQQIIQLPQYIRYRLIGSNIQLQHVCKYFDYRPIDISEVNQSQNHFQHQADPHEISEIEKWKKIYINQAEMTSIFMQEPFHLKTQQALLLARYIIEDEEFFQNGDPNNAFVYTNFENQIDRNVAKSIIKSFIQMHSTNVFQHVKGAAKKFENCQKEWSEIIKKLGSRINTPLMTIAGSGKISKQKWIQLIKSIVAQVSEDVLQWTIGRMLIESQGLQKLKYRIVVPSDH